MEESILKSTKKRLGLDEGYLVFDQDVIMFINSAFSTLNQLGIGVDAGLSILDDASVWSDLEISPRYLGLVKTYIYLKTRMLFDPPNTSYLLSAMEKQIDEHVWRMSTFREWELNPIDPVITS